MDKLPPGARLAKVQPAPRARAGARKAPAARTSQHAIGGSQACRVGSEMFSTYEKAEKHADLVGARRIECVL